MRHQPTLFFLASLLLLCSCQREKEYSFHKYHVINASLGDSGTRTTFESQAGSYDLLTKWQGHEYIKVFLNVDDGYNDAVRTVQVSKITADGTGATFRYKVPDEWGENDSYKVKMFTSTCLPGIMDGKIYYNASLIREPISSFQVPVFSEGEIVGEGELNASFHHYYTYELLHIKNTSNEDISFTLLGFEEGGWFKQKGSLCIDDGSFVVNAPSTKEPVTSTTVTVKAQESETIVSAYIPTGQPIQMARMVAQVNGQDVKSVNTKSSGVELKQGHAYHMYAGWNGKELRFWSNEEAPLDVETRSATFDPATFTGLFTGAVTNLADGGVQSVGFRFWRDGDPEDYVEFDATLADDNTFSLALRYKEFLEIAGDASLKGSYKVSAFALKPDGSRFHGDILEFTIDKDQPELPTEPTAGNLIDLGLSVAWASHNVGATKPQEVGGFYAWGETSTKSSYDWSNYALADGSGNSLKKYCTQSSYGTVDNKTTLEPSDDAAYAASQGRMRMPTAAEWQELKDYCVWTKMKYEGQDGYLVASPMTRNAIFIPANGFKTGTSYYNFYAPYYWTADLDTEVCSNALMVDYINQWSLGRQSRNEGLGIRPVSDGLDESTIEVDPTVLDFGKVAIGTSTSKPVTVTNTGTGSLTFYLVGGNEWFTFTPEDETTLAPGESCEVTITFRPQSASQMGVVLRVFSNATNGTKYVECTGEGVESLVPVPEMVDMGLSVLWASFNLGADSPTAKGKYYAWGETKAYGEEYPENENNYNYTGKTVKEKYYAETYIFGGQGRLHYVYGGRFSKYNGDDLNTLENQDDAAYLLLGEGWHIPTKEQWEELNNNTTWEQVDGGYRATSTVPGYTNVSIFLPYTGNRYEGSHLNGGYGVYWSSTLNQGEMVHGFNTSKEYGYHGITNEYRWDGLAIRPVHDKQNASVPVPEIIDLGLSVKWASFNLGASRPEEFGNYYAWGETEAKDEYERYNYKFDGSEPYPYHTLSSADDAAHKLLGDGWRIPTKAEWLELLTHCELQLLDDYSWKFTAPNGASIIIPAAGEIRGKEHFGRDLIWYWSSTVAYNGLSYSFYANEYGYHRPELAEDRFIGLPIRAVYGGPPQVTSIDVFCEGYTDYDYLSFAPRLEFPLCIAGSTFTKTITVYNEGDVDLTVLVMNPTKWDVYNGQGPELPYYSIPEQDRKFTLAPFETKEIAVQFTPRDMDDNGSGYLVIHSNSQEGASLIILESDGGVPISQGSVATPVDLGLSVKWASWNLGASKESDGGNYYAWGETSPKYHYSWETYIFYNKETGMVSKYNSSDKKTVLEPVDDAASVNWGEKWRMPTEAEYNELCANCSLEWVEIDGMTGCRFTGPNGNSIFMPRPGTCDENLVKEYKETGGYWFANLSPRNENHGISYELYMGSWVVDRYRGQPIRPVYVE